ncbi:MULTISPECIES: HNH endonuclease [unclassified Yoonia]|uniref:HNH endonuclease n=1 Tax=unclassified Yoonia TaxID=2629118 RepID=UPI002AFDFB93|nr:MULTISPECIES: HNH endonuclease [unclassified Yoonia]
MTQHFMFLDDSEQRWMHIHENHSAEAEALANRLVRDGRRTEEGCIVTNTNTVRKVRFQGQQYAAYRFIYCALNQEVPSYHDVIRHRCHNRLCINPDHLQKGTRADNQRDDWDHWANGIDHRYL